MNESKITLEVDKQGNEYWNISATPQEVQVMNAAPELLAALSMLIGQLEETGATHYVSASVGVAKRAIAKAEGKES